MEPVAYLTTADLYAVYLFFLTIVAIAVFNPFYSTFLARFSLRRPECLIRPFSPSITIFDSTFLSEF